MAVVASGNIKLENLTKWVEKYFTNLSNNKIQPIEIAKYHGGYFKKDKKLEQVNYLLGFQGISYQDKNYYKAQILSMILGGGMSSRLFQELREKKGLAYSVYSFNNCFADSGIFGIYCGTTPDKCQKMIDLVAVEIKKICQEISLQEIERVKTQFKASLKMGKESTSSRMQRLGSDILIFDKVISDDEIIEKFQDLTIKDILDFAQKTFDTESTVAMIGSVKNVKKITKFI
jgi:predicted Zn-dependent peptidase